MTHSQNIINCFNTTLKVIKTWDYPARNRNTRIRCEICSKLTIKNTRTTADLRSHRNSWTLDAKVRRWTLDAGLWALDPGLWTLDSGRWTLALKSRRWTLDPGLWTLDTGLWTLSLTFAEQNQNPVSDFAWLNYWKFFGYESLRSSWSRLFCRDCRFWRGHFSKFCINVKCYVIPKESFIVRNRITLQAAMLDCSEAAVHSHPFSNISAGNTGVESFFGQITDWLFRVAIIY